jgi:5-methyltetrahydrofolate--homocysteine methyltransferase
MKTSFSEALRHAREKGHHLLFEGAMGTVLQSSGMPAGERTEQYGFEHPDVVSGVHRAYLAAGANIVKPNTFGVSPLAVGKALGTSKEPFTVEQALTSAIGSAKAAIAEVKDRDVYVTMELGPAGKILNIDEEFDDDLCYKVYREQAEIGLNLGIDAVLFQTQSDVHEVANGLRAVRDLSKDIPVICSFSFSKTAHTFMGATPAAVVKMAEEGGATVVGVNCSCGPDSLLPVVKNMLSLTKLPVSMQPNAGLPHVVHGKTVYDMTPETFVGPAMQAWDAGVTILGGCCGTNADYIRTLKAALDQKD